MVSACMLMPGKFNSNLDIRRDGRFAFTYSGEMHFLTLSDFAKKAKKGNDAVFEPEPCSGPSGAERECSGAELDRQMRAWEERQKTREEKGDVEAQQMAAMFGGFDPSRPEAAEELAASLRRQEGWKRVSYRGNGMFDVEFSIAGRLDHDFLFPVMEGVPMANPFVQVMLRNDGTVRVEAPGFAPTAGPYQGFMNAAMMEGAKKDEMPEMPVMDGTFTITTDAAILANNTEEGPVSSATGDVLTWRINQRSTAAPTALIRVAD
jgi:hypothetical protein